MFIRVEFPIHTIDPLEVDGKTPEQMVEVLLKLQPSISEEQRRIQQVPADIPLNYTLNTLATALGSAGRFGSRATMFHHWASSRDLYERFINPNASERQMIWVSRGLVLAIGAIGYFVALFEPPAVASHSVAVSV